MILTLKLVCGHQRSKTVNWGHWGQSTKTIPRDAIFCMHNLLFPRNNIANFNLTSEVKGGHQRSKHRGHWRSKITYWGHNLIKTLRDTNFCMHTLIVSIDMWDCKFFSSEVTRYQKLQNKVKYYCQAQGHNILHLYSYMT